MGNRYEEARARYAEIGVDTETAIATLENVPLSIHCWQGDDVGGFETPDASLIGGGIQVTGNYPGKATTLALLKQDIEAAMLLIPGHHRLNLHAIYGDFEGKKVDRNEISPEHFASWKQWSTDKKIPLDFNATCFSHPKAETGLTLSSPEKENRNFWIDHVKRARTIAADFGQNQGSPSVHNLWIPDGFKDQPADRMKYRKILLDSLDEIFSETHMDVHLRDAVESKLFGIGSEAFVVGSHEFYLAYALSRNKMLCLDLGHFHPTESLADKLSALFLYIDEILLHVSRPMRWDSDHVVLFNDEIRLFMRELVRTGKLKKTHIGLDFFDGSINRIGAWAIGARSAQKGLLYSLLEPVDKLDAFEDSGDFFGRLATFEAGLVMPFGDVWDRFCKKYGAPTESFLIPEVARYEKEILSGRGRL